MSAGNWKELFHACETGDIALAKYHIHAGVDLNYQHPEYMTTALIASIRAEQANIVKLLLEHGADPHIQEAWGTDNAFKAAQTLGNNTIVELLNRYR